jgi:phosphatidate cytidylyltransferase
LSELTKRILSASLLAILLLADLWLGSWWYLALLVVGGFLVMREFVRLVRAMTSKSMARVAWVVFGVAYIGLALHGLWRVRAGEDGFAMAAWLFLAVWGTDVGAYIFGRSLGGPKIAPSISPSKTWTGLLGGIIFASLLSMVYLHFTNASTLTTAGITLFGLEIGAGIAILAQSGDFFESWMKRRAGVKDSGRLIPGHGGLFDRIDGLLPVAIAFPYLLRIAG